MPVLDDTSDSDFATPERPRFLPRLQRIPEPNNMLQIRTGLDDHGDNVLVDNID